MLRKLSLARWQGKRILVTGGTGFLGSHLVRRLVALGSRITCFARPSSSWDRLDDCRQRLDVIQGDLRQREDILRAVKESRPQLVFHLAAHGVDPRHNDATQIIQTNVLGLVYLLEALTGSACERFVNTGTCFEFGNQRRRLSEPAPLQPLNVYAASKTAAWHLCQLHQQRTGPQIVTLRPFTFFGPGERADRLIPSAIQAIVEDREICITSGEQTRDYTYVEDMVEAFLCAATSAHAAGETFNIGSGHDIAVREVARRIRSLMGSRTPIRCGAVASRREEAWRLCCDSAKAKRMLGWVPRVGFEEGLRRTIRWMQERYQRRAHVWRGDGEGAVRGHESAEVRRACR